jgi:hypothetical protein
MIDGITRKEREKQNQMAKEMGNGMCVSYIQIITVQIQTSSNCQYTLQIRCNPIYHSL